MCFSCKSEALSKARPHTKWPLIAPMQIPLSHTHTCIYCQLHWKHSVKSQRREQPLCQWECGSFLQRFTAVWNSQASSLLNHGAMDMLIWPSNVRQQLPNVLSAPYCEQVLNRVPHRRGDNSIPWHLTRVCTTWGPRAGCSDKHPAARAWILKCFILMSKREDNCMH